MEFNLFSFLLILFPLIMAICFHEAAHAWSAYKLGDNTAYAQGRVTLNPLSHIDPIGTIAVPVLLWFLTGGSFLFGWARPVPVNLRNFKNIKRDDTIVSAAGPLSNLLMALIWGLISVLSFKASMNDSGESISTASALSQMAFFGIYINVLLAVFNLIPLPPLDGSHILRNWLSYDAEKIYRQIEPYGIYILMALVFLNILPIGMISAGITNAIISFFSLLI